MEFNDENVRDFQASKLKEECFGGDNSSSGGFGLSSLDGWGLSNYGKSGYMLFYERRKKKPLKMLVQEEKAAMQSELESKDNKDAEQKEEQTVEVAYHEGVSASDEPNRIFNKVMEA
jgi:hypothetical protein